MYTLANISFSTGEGFCHLTTALQNHMKSFKRRISGGEFRLQITYSRDTIWIGLDEGAESAEGRIFLFIILDINKCRTPRLGKGFQVRSHNFRLNKTNASDGNCGILGKALWAALVQKDWNETQNQLGNPLIEVRVCKRVWLN
jgi:hypothetical protein